jgi:ferredoxin
MCEFCIKHGDGEKWYLEAKNYSDDLLSDIRRRKFIEEFFTTEIQKLGTAAEKLGGLDTAPWFVRRFVRWRTSNSMKKNHHGQVVPLEDIEAIFDFTNSIVRTSCACRHINVGKEKNCCYGVSAAPNGGQFAEILSGLGLSFLGGPDPKGLDIISKEEALASFKEHEREGLCHSVWTFVTPFIGGICNCDRPECIAMKTTVTHGIPIMFKAEYVGEADSDLCIGCRQCMGVCQFGAISYGAGAEKVTIDPRRCYGCGICRAACEKDAITLKDRAKVPVAANLW